MTDSADAGSQLMPWREQVAALARETDRAFLVAFRVTSSRALAEEAVQEAYARLLEKPRPPQNRNDALALLLKIVHDSAIDAMRSGHARKQREEAYVVMSPRVTPDPEKTAAQLELAQAARSALNQLDQDERVAVSLCCEQGLTRKVASKILGMPERTLSHHVERGLEHLRGALGTQGFAAAGPLVVAEGLQSLGLPQAPASLTLAVGKLTAAQSVKTAAGASIKHFAARKAAASAASSTQAAVVLMVLATVGVSGLWLAASKAPPQSPPAKQQPAPPIAPPVIAPPDVVVAPDPGRVLWSDRFDDLAPWIVTAWRKKGNISFELIREQVRSAPAALRLRYVFPQLKGPNAQMDDWLINHRTIERQIKIPGNATHLRMSLKTVSAKPGAQFNLALYDHERKCSWAFVQKLNEPGDWTQHELNLQRMMEYWQENNGNFDGKDVPPMPLDRIGFIELGVNWADAELLLDDIEFVQRTGGASIDR